MAPILVWNKLLFGGTCCRLLARKPQAPLVIYSMLAVQLFRRANENLPPLLQTQDREEALRPTLLELTDFHRNHVKLFPKESRRLVCDFSGNNFSLQHLGIVAKWLQQPTTGVEIHALDLSFKRILCPSWEQFVPLVK